ncbi:MAG: aminoglycoside phosphotransferase family protein [Bacteroidota bacterium]
MTKEKIQQILIHFFPRSTLRTVEAIDIGLINNTYKITVSNQGIKSIFILQRINTTIFPQPEWLMNNIVSVGQHLRSKAYAKTILLPVKTVDKKYIVELKGCYWRLYPFVENTHTFNTVENSEMAYSAAFAFGEYTRSLADLDGEKLHATIPDFHNTSLHYQQFYATLKTASNRRLTAAQRTIKSIVKYRYLVSLSQNLSLPVRVVHNDTKINNLLFDKKTQQPVCVIDLDTVMAGSVLYDYGDMVRTFVPNLDENSADWQNLQLRLPILRALHAGYLAGWDGELTTLETKLLHFGAQLTVFEQAIRFLTDYLRGDVYYPVKYDTQNLVRAKNQLRLLELLNEL